jgi:hypothetical protein
VLLEGGFLMDRQILRNEWKARIADYQSSDMTIKEWCQKQNLNYSQFHYWMRKFKGAESKTEPSTQWLSVDISDQVAEMEPGIFIRVKGVSVEIKPHFNPDLLLQVIRTLKEQ